MRSSIRAKLIAIILFVNMGVIALMWIMSVLMFKPMYYASTQNELSRMMNSVVSAIDTNGLTKTALEEISGFINAGVCIEIADENGKGIVLFEGIGDACQLHGAKDTSSIYAKQRTIDSLEAIALREEVREYSRQYYNIHLVDELSNRQAVKGHFYNDRYTIIVSTNLSRTDSIVTIVSTQLQTATIVGLVLAVLASAVITMWFLHPITKLSNATKEIAKGNYDVKVELDTTDEMGQLAHDFNMMTEEIKRSQELQRELIASISHDLRTPLTIIKGYAESIKDITGDNKTIRDQQLQTIIDEADRLSGMVGSSLEYAKLKQGAYKLNIVQFDIADMCQEIVEVYTNKAEKENRHIAYSGPESVYVFADPQLMERVLHNFVSNALLHTPEQTRVTIAITIQENGKIKISVYDSGSGIKQEDIPHLFDKYYRARKGEGGTGTGLGLAIVKSIMENHNFNYGVKSEEGLGTEFWFEI
ncbi:MAG: HAMP domain-containing histidine kinase [Oscillospiraceae bacterium]|nr:HAMP domain-containing histidine kinase [Oscillospiraceae bacterium]